MKRITIILFILYWNSSISQNIREFPYWNENYSGGKFIGLGLNYTRISNPTAPHPENHRLNAVIFDMQFNLIKTKQFGNRFNLYSKSVGDLIYLLGTIINGTGTAFATEGTTFSNLGGWMESTYNLNSPEGIFQISAGYNLGDYVYTGLYQMDPNLTNLSYQEPQGYYIGLGPTLQARIVAGKYVMFESSFSYAFALFKVFNLNEGASNTDYSYPLPNFGHFRARAISKWGAFLEYDYNWIINRGNSSSNAKRSGINLGMRFKFDE
jgi:hypothetical protein